MSEFKDFSLGVHPFQFSDLYAPLKLRELHEEFWRFVSKDDPLLKERFYASTFSELPLPQQSELNIQVAKWVGDFVARLFQVTNPVAKIKAETEKLQIIFRFKKEFLNIRVFRRFEETVMPEAEFSEVLEKTYRIYQNAYQTPIQEDEQKIAELVVQLLDYEKKLKKDGSLSAPDIQRINNLCSHISGPVEEKLQIALKTFEDWCTQMWNDPKRREKISTWLSYKRPKRLDFDHLVDYSVPDRHFPEKLSFEKHLRSRDGFKLTDHRMDAKEVLREIDYCIICHPRDKDSCSKGFPEKTGGYKKNPLGIPLQGCPLDEKISEMHFLRKQGEVIASLAMIMLDNPLCPGTGHRICNDCMKGCIFQKQDPVDIPQNETRVLTEVLDLPFGFEIYSLLTRFNPLNRKRPFALPYNGKKILIVGLGPAGYTLVHYLSNEGFGVVAIDALKVEPLDGVLTGKQKKFPKPIQYVHDLRRELDERIQVGFGGVSEYGITVRWDKNFLNIIYLTLLRRKNVRIIGGVRFGGTINLEDAWDMGFHHVCLATGAGKPTIVPMKNNLSRGIRKASDFLMNLQLSGAFKKNSLSNLQVRLPALVIGGGLTGIDTSTELLAYYPIQVEKILERFEALKKDWGEDKAWGMCDPEEKEMLKEFLDHGKQIREERELAKKESRKPNFIPLLREWGGVSLVYRKKLTDSPAYRLNHEEVTKALEEGIYFIENLSPVEAVKDSFGSLSKVVFKKPDGELISLPAKSLCVAAGTSPNTIYEKEYPGVFKLAPSSGYYQKHSIEKVNGKFQLTEITTPSRVSFFTSYENDQRFVSFYGDNHPDFAGNVVKAMASAKHGAPQIFRLFEDTINQAEKGTPLVNEDFLQWAEHLEDTLSPKVVKVQRLTPTIVEVIVKGKYVAEKFEAGQFFRLQNFETNCHSIDSQKLALEGLALTGAWVDKEKHLLSMIVLEMGTSSKLCATLAPGEHVVAMGPTGTPTEIPAGKNVLLVGGGLGNAVLLSVSEALKNRNSKVLYFAGYKKPEDLFKQEEVQKFTDQIVWASDSGSIQPLRDQDISFTGNIVQAMVSYASGQIAGKQLFNFAEIDHMIVIGSDRMMKAVSEARHTVLKPYLNPKHEGVASINSPMQCMMKEVCAQCLQRHIDPITKQEIGFVFSCFNQDQCMDKVDFENLNDRLKMNSLQEKISNAYLDLLLEKATLERV